VHFFFLKSATVIEYFINQFYTGLIVISVNERKIPGILENKKSPLSDDMCNRNSSFIHKFQPFQFLDQYLLRL